MEKWSAVPLVGVNGIRFGMSRKDVRDILKLEFTEFKKSKYSKNTTDDFGVCHVFYDADDKCQAIEIFDSVEIQINGRVIFLQDTGVLDSISSDFAEEGGSYISKSLSIGIYAPDGKIESILLAGKGYYGPA